MRKIAFLIIAVTMLSVASALCQNFEGKIVYKNEYKSKTPAMTDEQLAGAMGTTETYLTNGTTYKNVGNGTLMQWQLYIPKENKLYTKMSNSATIVWNDAAVADDSILKVQLNKGVLDVLGYKCDELILTCKSGVQKYYFNAKFVADPKLFVNHKLGNWYAYLKNAHALPLKSIIEGQQFTMISTATEVKPMKVDATEFQLPANAKTAKSPY